MKAIKLLTNGNKAIGINEYGTRFMVATTISQLGKHEHMNCKAFATLAAARREVALRVKSFREVGCPGEFKAA